MSDTIPEVPDKDIYILNLRREVEGLTRANERLRAEAAEAGRKAASVDCMRREVARIRLKFAGAALESDVDQALLDAMSAVPQMDVEWFATYVHPVWKLELARREAKKNHG